jgi:hypothetical protein
MQLTTKCSAADATDPAGAIPNKIQIKTKTRHKSILIYLTFEREYAFRMSQGKRMLKFLTPVLVVFTSLLDPSQSTAKTPASPAMNGYTLDQFGDFSKDWELVTVRYRKDSGEMRFTYANPVAWQTLMGNKTDYPNDAVFAKISIISKEDSSFPSSAVPTGARRVQFMVRNKEKHADTDGWGYALFDASGKPYPGEHKAQAMACMACHRLVPERGQVFSQPLSISGFIPPKAIDWKSKIKFEDLPRKDLAKNLQTYIPENIASIRSITGSLKKNPFFGTLDEIRPILTLEALRSGRPSALISEDGSMFSVVLEDRKRNDCSKSTQKALRGVHTLSDKKIPFFEIQFCENLLSK